MISVWRTRVILWKKQRGGFLFWLLFPIVGTISVLSIMEELQEDSKIPIGIVMNEDTELASELYHAISATPFLRIIDADEAEARQLVRTHSLDSAFVIEQGYENTIKRGNRNWLITSYSTDLSFGYIPVKEMVISYVQEASGKSKTAYLIQELSKDSGKEWTRDEIIQTANDIQNEEKLIFTEFAFHKNSYQEKDIDRRIFDPWGFWATFSLLATFFLFNWVIKERNDTLFQRIPFMRISMKSYFLWNALMYGILLFLFDLIAAYVFYLLYSEMITPILIIHILQLRITFTITAYLFALRFSKTFMYHSMTMVITLIIFILSGVIIPIEDTPYLRLHPFYHFLNMDGIHFWILPLVVLLIIWWIKGGKIKHA